MTPLRVALAGNPNSGKTTLFNALTGARQKVGNYAGVTVDTHEGRLMHRGRQIVLYDLPGTYSLTTYSLDEVIARDFILEQKPDVIIDVLDATNLERNLFLALQFLEFGIPVVGALNIVDQAEDMGFRIDEGRLSALLGLPLVRTVGPRDQGLEELLDAVTAAAETTETPPRYTPEVETAVDRLTEVLTADSIFAAAYPVRWTALKLLEKDPEAIKMLDGHRSRAAVETTLEDAVGRLERASGRHSAIAVSEARYGTIHGAAKETVRRDRTVPVTDYIDAVLMNRVVGLPIFLGILWAIFQATFTLGAYPQAWLEELFAWTGDALRSALPAGMLQSLLVDGIVGGVGNVLSFLPLVVILFFLISVLEDTGYMARIAFVTDRFLHVFGLQGQSFLPMMMGFGCSVPAIMASRSLKSPRDRVATVLVTPFMSCGAKLPVYVLLAGTFFPTQAGGVVLSIYVIGVLLALASAWLLRKTVLKGDTAPFILELPPYRVPTIRGMVQHVTDKSAHYFKKAGTVILAASVLIWALTTFPSAPEGASPQEALETSAAGWIGKTIEPAVKPLGFDWKVGIATVTGFAAKETVVSTLGILYRSGDDDQPLRAGLRADPAFNPLAAYTLMLFTLILAPCLAAQATMRAELGGRWLGFYLAASTALSWLLCFGVYQIGTLLGVGT